MTKIRQLCLISLLLTGKITDAASIRLQVEGLSGSLKRNVYAKLAEIENSTINNEAISDQYLQARAEDSIREGLKSLGYYEPVIHFKLHRSLSAKTKKILVAHIFLGKPVLISGTNVILRGAAKTDRDYLDLLDTCPSIGTVLNHNDYDRFKRNLTNMSLRKGYFDGHFIKSQLNIAVKKHQAFWNIDYDSGERYQLGSVTFENSKIRNEYLQSLIPFKKGDYYQSSNLSELNHRLSSTGWFNSIIITPELKKALNTKILPIHSVVSPNVRNTIETGVGYSLNTGPRVKVILKKPRINYYGHSLDISASIASSEQCDIRYKYKIPLPKNPLEQYYLLQGEFKHINLNDTQQDSSSFSMSRYGNLSKNWKRIINIKWSFDRFTQENISRTTILLYPSIIISRAYSNGELVTKSSHSQRYSIDYSNPIWGSNVNFFIIQLQHFWLHNFRNKNRFFMRENLGWIKTSNFKDVPPNLRFFAGGDRSIRGYEYKSIAPKNNKGKLMGASKLATVSLEYQFNVNEHWWSVVFIDSGEAVNLIKESNFKTGLGIGIHWHSPLGTIKFDFAVPMNNRNKHNFQCYIGVGPEL